MRNYAKNNFRASDVQPTNFVNNSVNNQANNPANNSANNPTNHPVNNSGDISGTAADAAPNERHVISVEMARQLGTMEFMSTRTSLISVCLQAYFVRNLVDSHWLYLWVELTISTELCNALLAWCLLRHLQNDVIRRRLLYFMPLTLFIGGLTWGSIVLLPGISSSPQLYLVTVLILAIVGIVSVHNLCFNRPCLTAFTIGLTAATIVRSLSDTTGMYSALAIAGFVLLLFIQLYAHTVRQLFLNLIISRMTSDVLAGKLKRGNEQVVEAMDQLRIMATLDPLTQCMNRRALMETLSNELTRQKRYGVSFGVIMLDLDHFKSINDNYGHGTGDAVLQATAEQLRTNLRPTDSVARWGGEEFLCLIAHADVNELVAKAEQICLSMSQIHFEHANDVKVTASLGVAVYQDGQSIKEIIDRADRAMYRAKNTGRNRVCIYDDGSDKNVLAGSIPMTQIPMTVHSKSSVIPTSH